MASIYLLDNLSFFFYLNFWSWALICNLFDEVRSCPNPFGLTSDLSDFCKQLYLLWIDNLSRFPCRSSRPEVLCKKGVLRNFTKFTGKHLCQSLFFNEVAGLRPATLLKKRLWQRCFPENFVNFLRTPFYIEHIWWLLLRLHLSILSSQWIIDINLCHLQIFTDVTRIWIWFYHWCYQIMTCR